MVMKEKIVGVNRTLLELIFGIFFYGIICQVIGGLLVEDKLSYSSGLWIGIITAVAAAIHMLYSIERVLDFDEGTSQKKMQAQSIIRYAGIVIIMGIVMINGVTSPLAAFLGLMGLKVAAYLQPFTHKLLIRFFRKEKAED